MEIQRMNAWLPWRPEARISPAVRRIFQRSRQLGSRFFSSVGAVAVAVALVLWFQPSLRAALAARLVPFLTAAAAGGPEVSRLFSSPFGSPRLPAARPTTDTNPLAQAVSDNDADANDVAQSAFFSAGVMGSLLPTEPSSDVALSKLMPSQQAIVADASDNRPLTSPREQTLVASYIARRYRVAQEPINNLVQTVFETGHDVGIDPLLLLSVIAIESGFNPYAESGVGAQGLMQVMSKIHSDKFSGFGGTRAALEPLANIKVGALVLKDCIARGGSVAGGLRLYNGATSQDDGGYSAKVMAERVRMRDALNGHKLRFQQTAMTSGVKAAVNPSAHLVTGAAKAAPTATSATHGDA
jgi:soluble lytic murein transglycosylase-like protein